MHSIHAMWVGGDKYNYAEPAAEELARQWFAFRGRRGKARRIPSQSEIRRFLQHFLPDYAAAVGSERIRNALRESYEILFDDDPQTVVPLVDKIVGWGEQLRVELARPQLTLVVTEPSFTEVAAAA